MFKPIVYVDINNYYRPDIMIWEVILQFTVMTSGEAPKRYATKFMVDQDYADNYQFVTRYARENFIAGVKMICDDTKRTPFDLEYRYGGKEYGSAH